jgi:hypothetical protein
MPLEMYLALFCLPVSNMLTGQELHLNCNA